MGPTCGAAGDSRFWTVRACVGVCARVLRPRVWGPCVCVRCARVCPACVRAWRRRARDPAAVVRARRSARPSAGAQHRLRPRVCMRGVSERVGGPSGVGCGAPRRGRRRSQDALAPGPAPPTPGPAAKRQLGPAGAPSPTAGRGPGGYGRRGGGVGRSLQAARPSSASSLPGAGRGGRPRKGGAPGRAAGGPRGAPRTKGDGDGSCVVKTTCAGGGPRPGRGLEARHRNPFAAAAASFLRLAGDREGPARPGAGEGQAPGRDPGVPRSPPPSDPLHLAPPTCPAPFPTWIPGRLANSLLREARRGGGLIRPESSCRRFCSPPPLQARLFQAARSAPCKRGREVIPLAGRGRRYGGAAGTHRLRAGFLKSPPLLPNPECPKPVSPHPRRAQYASRSGTALWGWACPVRARGSPSRPGAGARAGRRPLLKAGVAATICASSHLACKPGPGPNLSWSRSGLGRTRGLRHPRHHPTPSPFGWEEAYSRVPEGWGTGPHTPSPEA